MATISLSDKAPKVDEPIVFTLGNYDLELKPGDKEETDDALLLSMVVVHPWLTVEYPVVEATEAPDYDPNDPHDNPRADHLSPLATPEVKLAAAEAEAAIQREAYPNNPDAADAAETVVAVEQAKIKAETPEKPVATATATTVTGVTN